jgi:hypothetical protein
MTERGWLGSPAKEKERSCKRSPLLLPGDFPTTSESIACQLGQRFDASRNRLREKRNFSNRFNLIWVVQSYAKKYSASHSTQIDGFIPLVPPR